MLPEHQRESHPSTEENAAQGSPYQRFEFLHRDLRQRFEESASGAEYQPVEVSEELLNLGNRVRDGLMVSAVTRQWMEFWD
jgi:hypothetical protein